MRKHHDANQVYKLLVCRVIGCMMMDDPTLVDTARRENEARSVRPHTRDAVDLWRRLLDKPAAVIAESLGRDDPQGDYVRETMPAVVALDVAMRRRLVAESRRQFAGESAA